MARIRTIKPQFWLDEHLGNICRDARLLYIGLWNLSDDHGVFEYRPARIKVQLFPYDTDISGDTITEWLNILKETGDVIQFSANGSTFGYIPTFLKHQPIENPSKWRFAEIPQELLQTNERVLTETSPASLQDLTETSPASRKALSLGNREKGIGKRNRESNTNASNYFNTFWGAYPKKKSKGQAEKAFQKLSPDEKLLSVMLSAIEKAKKSTDWLKEEGQYIPYPATWLNAKGWEDEYTEVELKKKKRSKFGDGW